MDLPIHVLVGYAAADAVNPCALAVLSLVLISILTHNPKDKKKVLYAGIAFVSSVFILYFFYGLVLQQFFKTIQEIGIIQLYLYKILGGVAVVLGILNIKDVFFYKPGGLATEMPMFLRPKVKKIISAATSAKGAFIVGAFVTLFLLPCTIGPYLITAGMLSSWEILTIIPHLILYNAIFVLPMLAITIIVYVGIAKVQDVSEWKDKNIRYLHLVAGSIILVLGLAMIMGWV